MEAGSTANVQVVLTGNLSVELPKQRSKVVRIFTSSTFTDTSVERNALMGETYPRLKDYCKSRHGLEFQVIDMRWGVRDEATDDHMTSQLCMAEIAGCQRLSVGPNFVTFLCQKYGYRPFPPKIENEEFKILRETLMDNGKPIKTLDKWFICDENCIPPVYVLQPISSRLPYFNRQDDPEKMRAHKTEWWATFEQVQGQLRFAANQAEKRGLLAADRAKKYRISVTHDEVDHGILNAPSDRQNHCLCFIRKFSDLESKCEAREASKFLDLLDRNVDIEAGELLSDLRDNKVPQALPPSNIIVTDLGEWTKDGVNLENDNHSKYIKGFLDTFYAKIVSMVEIGVSKEKLASLEDPLHQEILQHLAFSLTKCVGFQGRDDIIKKVQDYIMQRVKCDDDKDGVPMVLYGESGSGKTSIMAKCAALVQQSWLCGTDTVMMLRFLGTSPNTSSIQRVLTTLCKQIIQVFNRTDFQVPTEYNKLVAAFIETMKFATVERPLVIFLDSLDQLSSDHGAHRMVWLPKSLPPNVALVVSTLPKEHGILEKVKERVPDLSQYTEVAPFSHVESTDILKSWLATAEKRVTNADGVTVMYWYHRQFIETARQRYLNDDSLKKKLHKTCAEYFDGTWSEGRKKPCRYSALQVERFGVPAEAEEDRKVSSQPLTFSVTQNESEGIVTFNLRKLTQLPFHLMEAEEWNTLKTSVLFNFDFMLSKVKALSMQDVLADFSKAEEKIDDAEIVILLGALRLSSSVISNNPNQLAPELMGRLMDAATTFPRMKSLLEQAKIVGRLSHPMLPVSTCLQPPGGMLLASLEGHTEEVVSMAITSDSRLVVTGSKDNTARIWQIENGTLVHILNGHREAVYGIEITPDDQSCVTYTHNGEYMKSGKICVWNMETGDLIHRLKGHTGKGQSNLAITLDGKYAVSGLQTTVSYDDDNEDTDYDDDEVIADSKQRHKEAKRKELMAEEDEAWDEEEYDDENRDVVIIWNLESGQTMHWLYKHTDEIKGVLTTEIDERQVAITFSQDHTLILWDILKGETIREMTDADTFPIWKVTLSEDRRLLALHGCEISLHSFPDCKYLGDSRDPESNSTVETMYITRDNSRVISGHVCGAVRMYGTGKNTERTLLKKQDCFERDGPVTSMAVTPNEMHVIAALKMSEAVVLNLETLEVEAKLPHILNVLTVAVTPDGSKILTGSEDKNVRIWDVANLKTSNSSDEPELAISKHDGYTYEALTLNADDKVITTGSDKTIKLWDVRSGKLIKSIGDPTGGNCYAVAISRDDTFMVGSSSGWYVLTLPDLVLQRKFREQWITPSHCVITPDNSRLVAGLGQPKFEIRILHVETGQTLEVIKLRSTAFCMLRYGVFINQYKIGMYDSSGKTKILQLIDSNQGQVISELRHADRVLSFAVSADERRLVAGCSDHDIDLWDLTTFSHITTMKAHTGRVTAVSFSPDGNHVASGADGGEVIIWDVQSQSLKHSMKQAHESDVSNVIFSPDGRFLVSSGQDDNYIQVWDTQTGKHLMKYHTYAKTSSIIMSAKCNTAIVTLQDGRVAFLTFSPSVPSFTSSKKSAPASVSGISMSPHSPMTGEQQPHVKRQMQQMRDARLQNQPRKSKTCQVL
ncbi:NACHT domain- and WD repeat-containing protein 1-like [Acanthaster planci]|uniref:NACHT domain- and WD repeat-containing protein 1-like n=1 Tax=Acanthaster planci TaxID=133434 RepID=A0A8B7ZC26_ACAPL|nr:NACHT domain- and WD repeat-containing protein 1-like [Acanthaster planci]